LANLVCEICFTIFATEKLSSEPIELSGLILENVASFDFKVKVALKEAVLL